MDGWRVADAEARLSQVMDPPESDGPRLMTRDDGNTVIVLPTEEGERRTKREGSLADFLARSPLRRARS